MREKERVRDEVAEIIAGYHLDAEAAVADGRKPYPSIVETLDKILSIKGLVLLSDNQKLPDNKKPNPPDDSEEIVAFAAYGQAQQDMKDWRRIVK